MRVKRVSASEECVCRLAHGSDAIEEIKAYAKDRRIGSAAFSLIGAVKSAKLSFYDQDGKKYADETFDEPLEIVSCNGNVCTKDGVYVVHAHACLGRRDGSTIGGHVAALRVFAGELHIRCFKESIGRGFDEVTGLNLMDFD